MPLCPTIPHPRQLFLAQAVLPPTLENRKALEEAVSSC